MSNQVKQLTLSAFFLALGLVLPFAFHSFGPQAGTVFLPMHIPVLLCGFVCARLWRSGWHADTAAVECINRHAAAHADRNCHVFGAVDVWLFERMDDKKLPLYPSLIITMLAGRAVSGLANLVLLSMAHKAYTVQIFLTATFVTAIPGIVLQLVMIPLLVSVVKKLEVRKAED